MKISANYSAYSVKLQEKTSFGTGKLAYFNKIYNKAKCLKEVDTIEITNSKGAKVSAELFEEPLSGEAAKFYGTGAKKLLAKADGIELGYMVLSNHPINDNVVIHELFNKSKTHKGVGSQLIKSAVKESIERGFEGRVSVIASNDRPPFVFYYKNNFRPTQAFKHYEPAIKYAADKDIPIQEILKNIDTIVMQLDETGAKKLLGKNA